MGLHLWMKCRDSFLFEICRLQTSIAKWPISPAKSWKHLPSSVWIVLLYNTVYKGCPGSLWLYYQCGSSEAVMSPVGRWLQQVPGPPEMGLEIRQLRQEPESLSHSRDLLCDSRNPVHTLTFYLFLCMWKHFTLCFACPIERQFLQLSCPVMPLSWESCCQEKMAPTLKQRWQCAI